MDEINVKEVYNRFCNEYNYLLEYDCNIVGYQEADQFFEYLFRTNEDFVKFVQKMVKERGCCFDSSVEHVALMFSLESLDALKYFD